MAIWSRGYRGNSGFGGRPQTSHRSARQDCRRNNIPAIHATFCGRRGMSGISAAKRKSDAKLFTIMNHARTPRLRFAAIAAIGLLTATTHADVNPYTLDADTLHLWHLDELGAPAADSVSGGTSLQGLLNG